MGKKIIATVAPWADEDLQAMVGAEKASRDRRLGSLSRLVEMLVMDPTLSYEAIVAKAREAFPHASTSTRSVASVACVMRSKGAQVPMRQKRAAKQLTLI